VQQKTTDDDDDGDDDDNDEDGFFRGHPLCWVHQLNKQVITPKNNIL